MSGRLDFPSDADRTVRFVRRIGGSVRRRVRAMRRRVDETTRRRRLRATQGNETALINALAEALPGSAIGHGPLVSIIILTRDGRGHLERCLRAVAATSYHDLEIIVVDNGSSDGSAEFAESLDLPFPIRVIRNTANRSFSEANAQGVAVAAGQLLCFLNNDVDPITNDWLGYMVETMKARDAVAVGARLIYPRHRGGARAGHDLPDLSLQHAGVDFDRRLSVPHARVMGAGDDALAPWASEIVERPALTAACLLVRLDAFREVGGFSPDYDYGIEDIDLCLKLRAAGGRLVYDGRAALWHHESATRATDRKRYASRVTANRNAFIDLWGPRIYRDALLDALRGGGRFSADPFHIAITAAAIDAEADTDAPTACRDLGDALERLGWRVTDLASADGATIRDPSVEAIVVVDHTWDHRPPSKTTITIAWIMDDAERWVSDVRFDDFDLVFAANDAIAETVLARSSKVARPMRFGATAIRDALVEWASATRYGLRIELADLDAAGHSDDYQLARGVQRHLERAGHPTRIHLLPRWGSPTAARDDVAVHLFGLEEAPTHRSQVDILWHLRPPVPGTAAVYERYDHVFVAPALFDPEVAESMSVPVESLDPAASFDHSGQRIRDVADRLSGSRPSGIDGALIAS